MADPTLTARLAADTKQFDKQMAAANAIATKTLNSIEGGFAAMGGRLNAAFASAVAGLSLVGLIHAARQLIDAGDEIADMAERIGISAEKLQVFQHAAVLAGASVEDFNRAAQAMQRAIASTDGEVNDVTRALARLGLSVEALRGLSFDQQLERIATAFAGLGDPMVKVSIATALFGDRLGQRLIPLLSKGAAGLKEMEVEFRRLGIIISDATIAKADAASDSWKLLDAQFKAAGVSIASELEPALKKLLEVMAQPETQAQIKALGVALREALQWLIDNRQTFIDAASAIGNALRFLGDSRNVFKDIGVPQIDWEKVKSGLPDVTQGVQKFRDDINDLNVDLTKLAATGGQQEGWVKQLTDAMIQQGFGIHAIAAALATVQRESSGVATKIGDAGTSLGLFQHHAERLTGLQNFARGLGVDWREAGTQIAFAMHELTDGGERAAGTMLRNAQSAEQAARAMAAFERFKGWNQEGNTELQKRIALTEQYVTKLQQGIAIAKTAPAAPGATPAGEGAAAPLRVAVTPAEIAKLDDLKSAVARVTFETRIAKGEFAAWGAGFPELLIRTVGFADAVKILTGNLAGVGPASRAAAEGLRQAFADKQQLAAAADAWKFFGNEVVNALDKMIFEGAKFQDVMRSILRSFTKELLRALITGEGVFGKLLGLAGSGGGVGGIFGLFGGLTGKATGGAVSPGRAYRVGERGSEVFVPASPGKIVPHAAAKAALGGGPIMLNYAPVIDARGADQAAVIRIERTLAEQARTFNQRVGLAMKTERVRRTRL